MNGPVWQGGQELPFTTQVRPTTATPHAVPTFVHLDRTLRVKVIDGCGMACTFCHNEGTPVAVDNNRRAAGTFTSAGSSGRVSIYVAFNGATFLPATIVPDAEFARVLDKLSVALDLNELHLTGVSGSRTAYALPTGRIVWFKQIRRVRLSQTCAACRFNNDTDCQEGFYGVRLYRDTTGIFQVGVCIQRMDLCLPLDQLVTSDRCREVVALRDLEYRQLIGRKKDETESPCPQSMKRRFSTSTLRPPPN